MADLEEGKKNPEKKAKEWREREKRAREQDWSIAFILF